MGWVGRHGKDVTRAPLDKVIAGLKAQGVTSFAANGFCFGGRSAFELTVEHQLKAVIMSHPSLLAIPRDLELMKANPSPIPMLFQYAVSLDSLFLLLVSDQTTSNRKPTFKWDPNNKPSPTRSSPMINTTTKLYTPESLMDSSSEVTLRTPVRRQPLSKVSKMRLISCCEFLSFPILEAVSTIWLIRDQRLQLRSANL